MDAHEFAQKIGAIADSHKMSYNDILTGLSQVSAAFLADLTKVAEDSKEEGSVEEDPIAVFKSTLDMNVEYYTNILKGKTNEE